VSFGEFLRGCVVATAFVAPLWLAARRLRVWCVPQWSGSLAWLADAVLFVFLVLAVGQLVGTFGLLQQLPLVVVALLVAGAVWFVLRRRPMIRRVSGGAASVDAGSDESRRIDGVKVVVVVLVFTVVVAWLAESVGSLRSGVLGYDSLNYHLPFAAHFAQTGRTTSLYYVLPGTETPFDPANAELLHAIGIVAWGRDILSPFLNLAFVALALLAGWCVGRTLQTRLASLAAVAGLVASPLLVSFNGGRATNDIVAIALFVAAVALILHADNALGPLGLAALASGMTLGTKLTMVVPVVALTIGVIAVAGRRRRLRVAGVWLPLLVVSGGYWYARNLFATGNPIPPLHLGIGPLAFPVTHIVRASPDFSVAHYATDLHVWRATFIPGLHSSLGWAWPALIGLAVTGVVVALRRGNRTTRMLALVAVVSFVAYLVTPNSAGGPKGHPNLFASDLRFAFPAVVLALLLAASDERSARARWFWLLIGVVALNDLYYTVRLNARDLFEAIAIVLFVLLVAGGVVVVRRNPSLRPVGAVAGVLLVIVAIAFGWTTSRSFVEHRYANATQLPFAGAPRAEVRALYPWARNVSHATIAVDGLGISYPLFGTDLSNRVKYIGQPGPHGAFDIARTCAQWRDRLNAARPNYVVISANTQNGSQPIQDAWTRTDNAATLVLRARTATVYRINSALHSAQCQAGGQAAP
jgi:hypothetical protein